MIHYHGTPISGASTVGYAALKNAHACVSYACMDAFPTVMEHCSSFMFDNGAFSFWKSGTPTNWNEFYSIVGDLIRVPHFDWFLCPDVIDGTAEDNDALLLDNPYPKHYSVPVFHLHEPIDRVVRLAHEYPRIALGSSAEYSKIGTVKWHSRMREIFSAITDKQGRPICKVHGLRMLDPKIYTQYCFSSCDSTNLARNVGIDKAWTGGYAPASKEVRATVLRERIEQYQSPMFFDRANTMVQVEIDLFGMAA
jgi:hypothetical protein